MKKKKKKMEFKSKNLLNVNPLSVCLSFLVVVEIFVLDGNPSLMVE